MWFIGLLFNHPRLFNLTFKMRQLSLCQFPFPIILNCWFWFIICVFGEEDQCSLAMEQGVIFGTGQNTSSGRWTVELEIILRANGITEPISQIIFRDSGLQIVNYWSETEAAIVNFENANENKPLHLFLKKRMRNKGPWAFRLETGFLMDYLPMARELCRGLGHEDLMDIYPKTFYADDKVIIQENLVLGRGFTLPSYKEELQDFHSAKLALINLAKHHAISHSLIEEVGGREAFFDRFPIFNYAASAVELKMEKFFSKFDTGVDVIIKMLENSGIEGSGWASLTLALIKGRQGDRKSLKRKADQLDFLGLSHGDYWTNNMMFRKDNESNLVTSQVIVDFQTVRYESPWVDLGYFLFTSVKPEVRIGRLRELLLVYVGALKDATRKLGYPIDMSLKDFPLNFFGHFYFGFWKALRSSAMIKMDELLKWDNCQLKTNSNGGSGGGIIDDCNFNAVILEGFSNLLKVWIDNYPEKWMGDVEKIIGFVEMHERLTEFMDG